MRSVLLAGAAGLAASVTAVGQVGYYDPTAAVDAVVVGDAAPAQGSPSGGSLYIRVDRVLKGSVTGGEVFTVVWSGPPPRRASGVWGDYGIWLLRAAGQYTWSVVPVPGASNSLTTSRYPVPAAPPAAAVVPNPTEVDLVGSELSNAVKTFDPSSADFYVAAEGLLRLPNTASLLAGYQQLSQSPNKEIQALGLTGRLFLGDTSALTQVAASALTLAGTHMGGHLLRAVAMTRDTTPAVVASLGGLATSPTARYGIQVTAAEALAKMHTQQCLPFLAMLLDAHDATLEDYAFEGFTHFVMNLPVEDPTMVASMAWTKPQGPAPYRTAQTEQYFGGYGTPPAKHPALIAFWKSWWAQHPELH